MEEFAFISVIYLAIFTLHLLRLYGCLLSAYYWLLIISYSIRFRIPPILLIQCSPPMLGIFVPLSGVDLYVLQHI